MKASKSGLASISAAVAACVALVATPVSAETDVSGSDHAFNEMIGMMAGRDTGSGWLDYYVEELNQQIAFQESMQPYGAAGPNGPLDGFNGYVAGFRMPDTGSTWFNNYVDAVNSVIKQKQQWMPPGP
ncbi:hypothetical protein [Polaromonas naphthalenivorans]|uniref:Lipoprotein n=1 Tax=Polaromonas naphthalenivorans (strain CJ2) TaxID=365044 RepID=A1VL31_POLNA|nr:hypothetical protein [Polaromonas naphthalenivorans]ABM36359.1 hypothetical protein Pnap_1042 [Polaromonas naphthalenivorans CJ2]MBH2010121.1 hypothetical protein [Xanthomonadaceae bacterium]